MTDRDKEIEKLLNDAIVHSSMIRANVYKPELVMLRSEKLSGNNLGSTGILQKALALIRKPTCKTCGDSGTVPTFDQASQTADADPCPDCKPTCKTCRDKKFVEAGPNTTKLIPCPDCKEKVNG